MGRFHTSSSHIASKKKPGLKLSDIIEGYEDIGDLRVEDILMSYDEETDIGISGKEYIIPEKHYTERDVFSEWGWYFIAAWTMGLQARKEDIKIAMFNELFNYNLFYSDRTFDNVWKKRRMILPFLYVESCQNAWSWRLYPGSNTFSRQMDVICDNFDERVRYFRRAYWACEVFQQALGRSKGFSNPQFPNWIEAESFAVRPLPDHLRAMLKEGRFESGG